jgi:hypothetical protein
MNDRFCWMCGFVTFPRPGGPAPPEHCPRCEGHGRLVPLLAGALHDQAACATAGHAQLLRRHADAWPERIARAETRLAELDQRDRDAETQTEHRQPTRFGAAPCHTATQPNPSRRGQRDPASRGGHTHRSAAILSAAFPTASTLRSRLPATTVADADVHGPTARKRSSRRPGRGRDRRRVRAPRGRRISAAPRKRLRSTSAAEQPRRPAARPRRASRIPYRRGSRGAGSGHRCAWTAHGSAARLEVCHSLSLFRSRSWGHAEVARPPGPTSSSAISASNARTAASNASLVITSTTRRCGASRLEAPSGHCARGG